MIKALRTSRMAFCLERTMFTGAGGVLGEADNERVDRRRCMQHVRC